MTTLADYKAAFTHFVRNSQIPDSTVSYCLNGAFMQVAEDLQCVEKLDTIAVVSGTSVYALNSDCLESGVMHAFYVNKNGVTRELDQVTELQRDKFGADSENKASGYPKVFTQWSDYIRLGPDPIISCTLYVDYAAEHPYLDADTNTVQTPLSYHILVLRYAKYLWYEMIENSTAPNAKQDYEAELQRRLVLRRPAVDTNIGQ